MSLRCVALVVHVLCMHIWYSRDYFSLPSLPKQITSSCMFYSSLSRNVGASLKSFRTRRTATWSKKNKPLFEHNHGRSIFPKTNSYLKRELVRYLLEECPLIFIAKRARRAKMMASINTRTMTIEGITVKNNHNPPLFTTEYIHVLILLCTMTGLPDVISNRITLTLLFDFRLQWKLTQHHRHWRAVKYMLSHQIEKRFKPMRL